MSGAEIRDELARIRAGVDAGNTDLKALGFWRVVGRVKRDPALIEAFADEIGAIDRKAFEAHFKIRPSVGFGNFLLGLGTLALFCVLLYFVTRTYSFISCLDGCAKWEFYARSPSANARGVGLVAVAGGLSVTVHDLAHCAVGRAGGIRFSSYFLDGPFRIQPGLKTDYASYLRAAPAARARMHAAGAVASKLAPFAVGIFALGAQLESFFRLFPTWSFLAVFVIGVVQIVTDVAWSTKRSDWKKYSRERALAKELRG